MLTDWGDDCRGNLGAGFIMALITFLPIALVAGWLTGLAS